MTKREPKPIDGVIQRRRRRVGDLSQAVPMTDQWDRTRLKPGKRSVGLVRNRQAALELPATSVEPDDAMPLKVRRGFWPFRRKLRAEPLSPRRRRIKRVAKVGGLALLLLVAFFGVRSWMAIRNIIDRGSGGAPALADNVDPSQLRGEGDGRVNILLVGIGGRQHEAGNLADTIIVASLDPVAKEMAMLSIPRDFYVPIEGFGSARVNAAHSYGEDYNVSGGGVGLLSRTLESTLGVPIHYYARVDFEGFRRAIDTVGGVDINVKETVVDYKIAWQYGINQIPAGQQHLDGNEALFYVRSRNSARGDFDRGDRQRQVLLALKDEILATTTLVNPAKIASLLSTAGKHARTNLNEGEMMRVYEIIKEIPSDKFVSRSLNNDAKGHLIGASVGGASVLVPRAGIGDFSEIQRFVRKLFLDGFLRSEGATVDVLNGTAMAGLATTKASELKSFGYKVEEVGDAPKGSYAQTVVYDLTNGQKPYTKRYLEQRFKVTVLPGSQLPPKVTTTSNFVIILGENATITTQ